MNKKISKPSLLLIWHEAGNPLYWDRFFDLSKYFKLTVFGFNHFQGVDYDKIITNNEFHAILFKPFLSFHWLTVFSTDLLKKLVSNQFDYIYIHEEPHSLLSFLVTLFAGNSKSVIDSAVINKRLNFFGFNIFEKFVYSRLDGIFYRNNEVKNILLERGAPPKKIKCKLGNGVSRKTFRKVATLNFSGNLKGFPQKRPGILIVGYAGRIWKWKGVKNLTDIASLPNVKVVACGPVWDSELARRIEKAGVTVLPKLGRDELIQFYSSLDLFILPSLPSPNWIEQFGRVIVESVFCGTPAIGSDTGFIPTLVGENAVFKADNSKEIQQLVLRFHSPKTRIGLLEEQKQRFNCNYSWEAIAKSVKRNLEKL